MKSPVLAFLVAGPEVNEKITKKVFIYGKKRNQSVQTLCYEHN